MASPLVEVLTSKEVIGAAIASIATSGIAFAGSLLKDLDKNARRSRRYDEAAKQLAVTEAWVRVENFVAPDELARRKEQIRGDLEKIYLDLRTLAESSTSAKAIVEPSAAPLPKSRIRRILLLYKPPRARAWIPRILFFYGYVIGSVFSLVRSVVNPTKENFSFLGVDLLLTVLFRALSVWLET